LRKRWEELTPRVRPTPTEVAFIFEASERGDALVKRYFSDIVVTIAGARVPIQGIMPKWAGDEALEVADFIVHAAGTQARNWDTGGKRFRRDFEAVFQANALWSSFNAIESVH
jgi:hypothetical protein